MCVAPLVANNSMRLEHSDPWSKIHGQERKHRSEGTIVEPVLQGHELFMKVAIGVAALVLFVPVAIEAAKWSLGYISEGWETISQLLRRIR